MQFGPPSLRLSRNPSIFIGPVFPKISCPWECQARTFRALIPLLIREVRFADSDGVHRTPEIGGVRGWLGNCRADFQSLPGGHFPRSRLFQAES
jgi:hypothetical protein